MSRAARLLSPDLYQITAERMSLMARAEHLTVGGGDSQSRGWHLSHPKIGGQYRTCMGYRGSGS